MESLAKWIILNQIITYLSHANGALNFIMN